MDDQGHPVGPGVMYYNGTVDYVHGGHYMHTGSLQYQYQLWSLLFPTTASPLYTLSTAEHTEYFNATCLV